jgi:hypothetical protein
MRGRAEPIEERATKGLLAGWWAAKTTAWSVRLAIWGTWLALFAGYVLYVWLRVRRMLKAEREEHAGAGDVPARRPDPPSLRI